MPYWIQSTLLATPALLWLFFGFGLPWALVLLPHADWRDRGLVACLTLAFGPALLTAWMFVLGSVQSAPMLRLEYVLAGTAVMALAGWALVWRKYPLPLPPSPLRDEGETANSIRSVKLATDEKLLIGLVGVALVVRWLGVAYWPSTAYDALWVYAYEGKLYTLTGMIPTTISYYPQFLPLLHTYLQLAVGGVNDHAARAVLPFLHLGSILATYVMGSKLFNRRVGIIAAAIWALYPHVGEWSRYGDLEVPMAFMFTGAAAFFVAAWTESSAGETYRRNRYALIAGLFLGIGMWTKPTMGAFIWGVALVIVVAIAIQAWFTWWRSESRQALAAGLRPRAQVVLITALASIPLGVVWYVRNILLGYEPIDLPPGFWQSLAARSGVELGWPLLALLVVCAWVLFKGAAISSQKPPKGHPGDKILRNDAVITGLVLVVVAVLPSIRNSGQADIGANRMQALEWIELLAGCTLIAVALVRWSRGRWTEAGKAIAAKLGWLALLGLPYFVTWFYSYSYHYRLSFAIVPLMIMPTAVMLAAWVKTPVTRRWSVVYAAALVALALPGIRAPLYDPNAGWDWLWTDSLPDDHARYQSGNTALMAVVDGLQTYADQNTEPMHVVAPGIKQLPFFFPTEDIRINTMPTRLDELEGVTYFIYGKPESGGDLNTFKPGSNQVIAALSMAAVKPDDKISIMRRAWGYDDGVLMYSVYELHLENRFKPPFLIAPTPEGDVVFGGLVRFLGHDIGGDTFWPGRKLTMHLYWQVLEPLPADYTIYIHLRDTDDTVQMAWDGPVTRTADGNYYSTLVWEPGEYITDERTLVFDNPDAPPADKAYRIVIGIYDPVSNQRLPVTINGEPASDGYTLSEQISVVAKQP